MRTIKPSIISSRASVRQKMEWRSLRNSLVKAIMKAAESTVEDVKFTYFIQAHFVPVVEWH